jgi:acyl carrier protein
MNEARESPTREEFTLRLLDFVNETLPQLDRRGRTWPRVQLDTPLFSDGLLDSLSILHLIAKVEDLVGRAVPDHLVVMRNFHSVEAITQAFCRP